VMHSEMSEEVQKYRRTFFEKPSGYRVRMRLFVGTVEQDLIDFRF